MVLMPGAELVERMRQYAAFSRSEILAQLQAQESASLANRPLVEIDFPSDLVKSGTVAVIYDETQGLSFFAGFGEFERAFTEPALLEHTASGLLTTSTTTAFHRFPSGGWPIGIHFGPVRCSGGCLAARASTGRATVRS